MLRTCLILSDDPDDQIEFTEAINEVSENTAVMVMTDAEKAIELLLLKKILPDIIVVDVRLNGCNRDVFLEAMQNDHELAAVTVVAYGSAAELLNWTHPHISFFLEDDISYSGLRISLSDILNGRSVS